MHQVCSRHAPSRRMVRTFRYINIRVHVLSFVSDHREPEEQGFVEDTGKSLHKKADLKLKSLQYDSDTNRPT